MEELIERKQGEDNIHCIQDDIFKYAIACAESLITRIEPLHGLLLSWYLH